MAKAKGFTVGFVDTPRTKVRGFFLHRSDLLGRSYDQPSRGSLEEPDGLNLLAPCPSRRVC